MNTVDHTHPEKNDINIRFVAGIIFVISGGVLFLDSYLKTGWLALLVMPSIGIFLYQWGLRVRHKGLVVSGGILGGTGVGVAAVFNPSNMGQPLLLQLGTLAVFFALGCFAIVVGVKWMTTRVVWWALLTGGAVGSFGLCILFTPFGLLDIVLFLCLGVGLPFITWGLGARIFGLIIPGCILITTGPGIYLAWGAPQEKNGLVQTGMMIIWFSFGWILMTLSSRLLFQKFAWWPLIPGGILATVGLGLYIGGDPGNALGFIGNTGSVALMIFGLYLLLMRKGIHH